MGRSATFRLRHYPQTDHQREDLRSSGSSSPQDGRTRLPRAGRAGTCSRPAGPDRLWHPGSRRILKRGRAGIAPGRLRERSAITRMRRRGVKELADPRFAAPRPAPSSTGPTGCRIGGDVRPRASAWRIALRAQTRMPIAHRRDKGCIDVLGEIASLSPPDHHQRLGPDRRGPRRNTATRDTTCGRSQGVTWLPCAGGAGCASAVPLMSPKPADSGAGPARPG